MSTVKSKTLDTEEGASSTLISGSISDYTYKIDKCNDVSLFYMYDYLY